MGWWQKRHVRAQGIAGQLSWVIGGAEVNSVHFCQSIIDLAHTHIDAEIPKYWSGQTELIICNEDNVIENFWVSAGQMLHNANKCNL